MPISKKDNLTAAFGEWALLDSEVVPVQKVMEKYNWTQTALHHHMLGETPKVLFLHWAVTKSYRYNKSSQGNHYANIYIPKYYWANTYT
jgi:hypothetical protein